MNAPAIISIKNASKRFDGKNSSTQALEDISLDIYEGEIFGIIGTSGAGKSTLVRLINLLEKPNSGSVTVLGSQLLTLTDAQLRQKRQSIGMIFQQFNLLMQRSVLGNVMFPLEVAGKRKNARQTATALIELVGLADKINEYPARLSGGQRQRVAIARALATQPQILLCDEATSALDPENTQSILALLKKINTELGLTIVIITHQMSIIERVCTRACILDGGRVAEVGDTVELFSRPKTQATRRLLYAGVEQASFNGDCYRIVFDGQQADEPLIASMVLELGVKVNILFANTQVVGGKTFGQMIIEVASDADVAGFLNSRKLSFDRLGEGANG